ncbi:MAG: Uncharacterised protein [Flavobacterium sp. SCGC AAA160-P02]|nr:MAG: Uncharacterised protein [Flavobacterium sp. SCGC AAA160-P02]
MTKIKYLISILSIVLISIQLGFSQEAKNEPQKPYQVNLPSKVEKVPSIASQMSSLIRPNLNDDKEVQDGRYSRASKIDVVIGKGSKGDDQLAKYPNKLKGAISNRTPELVFETGASSSQPTDPAGAVGPNHYISVINTAFQIFDKSGNSLTGGLVSPNPTIFPSGGCCDLTASYDNAADRWVLSLLGGGVQVAISDGPDPVNDGWTVYSYSAVSDYQKLSVWWDGYYMTENTGSANKVHVFERSAMIDAASAGTTPQIVSFNLPGLVTSGFHSPQVLNISGGTWPTSGGATVVYMQDDAWSGVTEDHIKLWTIDMDWENTGNSTVSAAQVLGSAEGITSYISVFDGGSFSNLTQPNGGISIDALQATIMNQSQYRKFGSHNSALFNFVVDVDGSSVEQGGVRWYELRQTGDGEPWTLYQEGTYTAPDSRHAWNASLIMDYQGNIGLGYSGMSSANSTDSQIRVGSYYTGRYANDPLGTMTIEEGTIMAGDANIPGYRYGDYSKIDIDPSDDKKFWFINELMNGGRKNIAGVFQIAPNFNDDIGIVSIDSPTSGSLNGSESIIVTIFNYGQSAITTFDVTYQIDGGSVVSEPYTGASIASGTSEQFTFSTPADFSTEGQTYTITASTDYGMDEDNSNNSTSINVTHIYANDLGVTAITSPVSSESLGNEAITVTIENFGTASQSNFDVSYSINGGVPVMEQVTNPLSASSDMQYTFATLGDFSLDGTYDLVAQTALSSDSNTLNNAAQVSIDNTACTTEINDSDLSIGPNAGTVTESVISITEDTTISDLNVILNIEHTWVSDLDVKLISPDGTEVILFEDVGSNGDFFTNTVLDDDASSTIDSGSSPFTGTFSPQGSLADFNGMSSSGDWTLSITDDANQDGGNLLDWSLQICSSPPLSVIDENNLAGDLRILNKGDGQYEVVLNSDSLTEDLDLNVFNLLGQNLLWKTIKKQSGTYSYNLNMSYASSGVYIIRIGNKSLMLSRRIVVE